MVKFVARLQVTRLSSYVILALHSLLVSYDSYSCITTALFQFTNSKCSAFLLPNCDIHTVPCRRAIRAFLQKCYLPNGGWSLPIYLELGRARILQEFLWKLSMATDLKADKSKVQVSLCIFQSTACQ